MGYQAMAPSVQRKALKSLNKDLFTSRRKVKEYNDNI
jgi:hypothetical protein